jgi:hypothetical protein
VRVGLMSLVAIVGCIATVGAAPRSADDKMPPSADASKLLVEAPIARTVPMDQLIDQIPDGGIVIELYKNVRTVSDVEAVNEYVEAQVIKAQSIVAEIARLHAATLKSCEGADPSQLQAIADKTRNFSTTLARVDRELTKSLAATRQSVEMERPSSTKAKEDINRLVLVTHEVSRLRVQAEEIAKSVGSLGVSIRTAAALCKPTPVLPLFAERDGLAVGAVAGRSPTVSPKRASKRSTTPASRFVW